MDKDRLNLLLEAERRGILPDHLAAPLAEARKRGLLPEQQSTSLVEQAMNGVNESIASALGAPVDLMTMGVNASIAGVNKLAGTDIPTIKAPVGGSGMFESGLEASGAISDTAPQTGAQRYARSIGQETGAMALPGGIALRGAANTAKTSGALAASATGAGIGAQAASDLTDGHALAETLGSLLGGLSPAAVTRAAKPRVPSMEDLRSIEAQGYGAVEQSTARLSPEAANRLADSIQKAFGERTLAMRKLNPKAAVAADAISQELRTRPPTIAEMDEVRRWIGKNVAGSADASERAMGVEMKRRIDDTLDALAPGEVTGTNDAQALLKELKSARSATTRRKKAEILEGDDIGALDRGATRDMMGGSENAALLQRLRGILENPKQRRQFKDWELQAMRDIIKGSPSQRAARFLAKLAPTSGQLPMGGFVGASAGAGLTGNPALLAPSGIGAAAKKFSDIGTRRGVRNLAAAVRNGGPIAGRPQSDAIKRMVAALLASQGLQADLVP